MPDEAKADHVTAADAELVLAALERDQLAEAHKFPIPRRQLKGGEKAILWSLRIYLLFMLAVVVYQIWSGGH